MYPLMAYIFHAYHLTETLKLKSLDRIFAGSAVDQSAQRLIYSEGDSGYFFVYSFGSVIFFDVGQGRRDEIIERMTEPPPVTL